MPIPLVARPNTAIPNSTITAGDFNEDLDTAFDAIETITKAVNAATGTKSTLNDRLSVAMNADGTLRTSIGGSEWIPGPLPTYITPASFKVAGNNTDIYARNRRVRFNASAVTGVKSSSYASGETTVTTFAAVVPLDLFAVEHSIHADADVETIQLSGCIGGTGTTLVAGGLKSVQRIKVSVPGGKKLYLRRARAYFEDTGIRLTVDDWTSSASIEDAVTSELIFDNSAGSSTIYLANAVIQNTGAGTATINSYDSWHLTLTVE